HNAASRPRSDGAERPRTKSRCPAPARFAQEARGQGATVRRRYQRSPYLALEVNENALRGLLRSPRVVSVIKDEPSPPALDTSMAVIGGDVVHTLGWDGSGLAVVILDTGIDRNHPFVSGR